jgi:fumarate hydratase class II
LCDAAPDYSFGLICATRRRPWSPSRSSGDHAAIAFAGSQEHFELNAFKPVMIHNLMLVTALNRNVGYDKPKTAHQKDIARRESRTRLFDGERV